MPQSGSRLLMDLLRAGDLGTQIDGPAIPVPAPNEKFYRIEGADMATMLEAAGAPQPWLRPDKCIAIVGIPVEADHLKLEYRAQNAINELRRVLPQVIENEERRVGTDTGRLLAFKESQPESVFANLTVLEISEELSQRLDNLGKLRALCSAAGGVAPFIRPGMKDWHSAAIWLASYYKGVVGAFKISADGPAVRFIGAALKRLGWHGMITPAAIAKAVRVTEKNRPVRKFPDTSGDSSQ
jgi:hypothetical protein